MWAILMLCIAVWLLILVIVVIEGLLSGRDDDEQ